jgi:hypothetical protein
MKPHNLSERNRAFRNFLVLFIITVAIVMAAVFFSIQVPFKENDQLRAAASVTEKQRVSTVLFGDKMETTMRLLDSVNLKGAQAELIDGDIDENLRSMNAMVKSDTSLPEKGMFTSIINNFRELKIAKKQLRDASGKDATFGDLTRQNAELHARVQQVTSELQQCQFMVTNYLQQR